MSPHPKTLSPLRRAARKLPAPLRRAFVRAVDSLAWRERKPRPAPRWWCGEVTATAAEVLTEAKRREALKELARTWHETGSEVRTLRLRDLAHPSLAGWDLDEAWDTLQGDLALLDGLNSAHGAVECHWSDVNDELTGPDRTEAARDEMEQRVGGALDRLIRGKR